MQLAETNEFGRITVFFIPGEYMADGIAQGKLGLKICAVEHVADAMQVASGQNSVLRGCQGCYI